MALRFICKQSSPSDGRRAYTFSVAAFCVIICFAATAIPVPLIAIWTQALSLTTFEVSMTVFAYVGGCLTVLLFFSKLSNYLDRLRGVRFQPGKKAGLFLRPGRRGSFTSCLSCFGAGLFCLLYVSLQTFFLRLLLSGFWQSVIPPFWIWICRSFLSGKGGPSARAYSGAGSLTAFPPAARPSHTWQRRKRASSGRS